MILQTVAFVAGVVLLQYQSELPKLLVVLGLIPLTGLAIWLFRRHSTLQSLVFLLAGFLWAALQGHQTLSSGLDPTLEGEDLLVKGRVFSLPDSNSQRTRFEFQVESMTYQGDPVSPPKRLLVSWYKNAPVISVGEQWQLLLRLKRPHGLSNAGSFDYERTLFSRGIRATGYVRESHDNHRIAPAGSVDLFNQAREHIGKALDEQVHNASAVGIARALVIGDRSRISSAQWELFRQTGTNHLMAISGLHIGIVSGLFFFLGKGLWRRFYRGC
ncbi:MAG: ComEC/Rec2 family competence protein, partial [Sedimenticola sp.]|nr:ComEC/Rec2 family competence protein [Sedimenticola sp.]